MSSGNYLRINDLVKFSLLDNNIIKIKDDYEGAFKPQALGSTHPSGMGTVPDDSAGMTVQNGLQVRIAATHAGIITRNNGFYLPNKMKKGASTFTENYPKPVLLHHQDKQDPIGRIIAAVYVDTSGAIQDQYAGKDVFNKKGKKVGTITDTLIKDFVEDRMPFGMQVDVVTSIFRDSILDESDYEGLGHIQVVANITDHESVQKLLDGRYITGSVGATTDKAVCSVCKSDLTETGPCEHKPGGIYDGAKCFIIAGSLKYDEYSFVNVPADRHSRILELNYNGIQDNIEIVNDYSGRICEVRLEFPQYDSNSKEDVGMADNDKVVEGTQIQDAAATESKTDETEPQNLKTEVADSHTSNEGEDKETTINDDHSVSAIPEEGSVEDNFEDDEDFLTRLFSNLEDKLSKEDELRMYDLVLDAMVEEKTEGMDQDETNKFLGWTDDLIKEAEETDKMSLEGVEGAVEDAKLTTKARKALKGGSFCGPNRTYPAQDKSHAVNALARVKQFGSSSLQARVRACVCRKFPSLPSCGKSEDSVDTLTFTGLMTDILGKDAVLTPSKRKKLPLSAFCGPSRSFPLKDCAHVAATLRLVRKAKLTDEQKGEVLSCLNRKSRAMDCGTTSDQVAKDSVKQDSTETTKIEDVRHVERIMHMILSLFEEESFSSDEDKVLDQEEMSSLRNVLKRLATMVGKDSFVNASVEEELAIDPDCSNKLLDEVTQQEETIGNLREQLSAVRKEYNLLFKDMETLQDSLVDEKTNMRKTKEGQLSTLLSLQDHKTEDRDFSEFTDSALDSEIQRINKEVDMNKIVDKLGDGMSGTPTETVDDPTGIHDNKDNQKRYTVQDLKPIEETYYSILFRDGQLAAEAFIEHMKKEGKLPQDGENN